MIILCWYGTGNDCNVLYREIEILCHFMLNSLDDPFIITKSALFFFIKTVLCHGDGRT